MTAGSGSSGTSSAAGPVVLLAGGTGGAKLARGLLDVVGSDLVVIANTADDAEIYDVHVSPDPDLISYWLADRIDERGWGIDGDTWEAMDARRARGEDVWFNLGDQDLAVCARRARRLADGARLTDAILELGEELGLGATVLPMTDEPVRTRITAHGREWPFQEFMIRGKAEGPIDDVAFDGATAAVTTPEVVDAIAAARTIVFGPSNPVISIAPILAVPGIREAMRGAGAPVVAVSPVVRGQILKGPTADCMRWAGHACDAEGVIAFYGGLIDGFVTDEHVRGARLAMCETETLMSTPAERRQVADETLAFAEALARR
jgi:LPPG:FO 2-phospho-L-lactate transferase